MPKYIKNYQKQTFYWPKIREIRRDVSDKPPHPSLSPPSTHTHGGGPFATRKLSFIFQNQCVMGSKFCGNPEAVDQRPKCPAKSTA